MKLASRYLLASPRERVFASLTDPEVLKDCIEGCRKLERVSEDVYESEVRVGISVFKGTYKGRVELKDKKPPGSFTLVLQANGLTGWIRGTSRVELVEKEGQTELRLDSDVQVGGLLAAVASRLVEGAAKKMLDDSSRRFAQRIAGG